MLTRISRKNFSKSVQKELAYLSGTSKVPLICDTIGEKLRKQAALYPNNSFQVFCQQGLRYTYHEFDQRVDEIAKGFIALGLERGDRVGIYSPNRPEWALTQYA